MVFSNPSPNEGATELRILQPGHIVVIEVMAARRDDIYHIEVEWGEIVSFSVSRNYKKESDIFRTRGEGERTYSLALLGRFPC